MRYILKSYFWHGRLSRAALRKWRPGEKYLRGLFKKVFSLDNLSNSCAKRYVLSNIMINSLLFQNTPNIDSSFIYVNAGKTLVFRTSRELNFFQNTRNVALNPILSRFWQKCRKTPKSCNNQPILLFVIRICG